MGGLLQQFLPRRKMAKIEAAVTKAIPHVTLPKKAAMPMKITARDATAAPMPPYSNQPTIVHNDVAMPPDAPKPQLPPMPTGPALMPKLKLNPGCHRNRYQRKRIRVLMPLQLQRTRQPR